MNGLTPVVAVLLCVVPFAFALIMARRELAREAWAVWEFERTWGGGHDWHEWIEHPVYRGRFVCRFCPSAPGDMTAKADRSPKGGDAQRLRSRERRSPSGDLPNLDSPGEQ